MNLRENNLANLILEENRPGFERLNALCDGVFAIAITLLVLDIKLPEGLSGDKFAEAWDELLTKSIFYLLTFVAVAGYWMAHRRLMTYIKRQDGPFTVLTFLFLAFVVFFPVSFNIVVGYGGHALVAIFYTLILAGCGFSSFLIWTYASTKHRLIDPNVSQHEIRLRTIGSLLSPVYFSLSLLLLLIPNIPPYFVYLSWMFIPLIARIIHLFTAAPNVSVVKKRVPPEASGK